MRKYKAPFRRKRIQFKLGLRIVLFCLIYVGIGTFGNAQSLNLKGGVNLSYLKVIEDGENIFQDSESEEFYNSSVDTKGVLGYNAGLTYEFKVNDLLHIETGLLLSSKGFTIVSESDYTWTDGSYNRSSGKDKFKEHFLDIPVVFMFGKDKGDMRFYGNVGAFVGLAFFGKVESTYTEEYKSGNYEDNGYENYSFGVELDDMEDRLNFGGIGGLGVQYHDYYLEFNYTIGVLNPDLFDADEIISQNFGLSLGYKFGKEIKE